MRHPLKKIMSCGLTNVEQAALGIARGRDFPYSGWCVKGQRLFDVLISEEYSLSEIPSDSYEQAIEWNVHDSDGTLVLTRGKTTKIAASALEIAGKYHKPLMAIDFDAIKGKTSAFAAYSSELGLGEGERISKWLHKQNIEILNVIGSSVPEMDDLVLFTHSLVWRVLQWNDRIELCLKSPFFIGKIRSGKYTEWAVGLDVNTLEGLLWAIGEFGSNINSLRMPNGELPDPVLKGIEKTDIFVGISIEEIAAIQAYADRSWILTKSSFAIRHKIKLTPQVKGGMPVNNGFKQFLKQKSIFIPEFQKRLDSDGHTRWAQYLSAYLLERLLFMVGEYGARMAYKPPPDFSGGGEKVARARAALQLIGIIHVKRCKYNVTETKSWICKHSMQFHA